MLGRTVGIATALVAALVALAARTADADAPPLGPPVTSTHYAIELYDNSVLGDEATIAMGGAAIGNAHGSSGTLANASAPAVRSTTDNDHWSIDYHLGYLNSSLSTDYDNNGSTASDRSGTSAATAGLAFRYGDWGYAATGTWQSADVADGGNLTAETLHWKLAVARWVPRWDLALGGAVNYAQFEVNSGCSGLGCGSLFKITGTGAEAGATWIPHGQSFRIGADAQTGIQGDTVANTCGDPMSCHGYILPDRVVSAWRVGIGGAYRFGPLAWNQQVHSTWRDEKAVTLVGDLIVIGSVPDAFGIEAFGRHELQRAGEHPGVSARGGVEYEIKPGRLRLRGGSYWEPGRFNDVPGRVHGTFGLEVRVFEFWAFGLRRGKLALSSDLADRYSNVAVSIGFWH